jgi:methyl-accepting chemotaxis protein
MTVGRKLLLANGGLVVALLVTGAISIFTLGSLNQATQRIISDPMPGMATITRAQAAVLELRGDSWRHISSSDNAEMADLDRSIAAKKAEVEQALREYEKTIATVEDRAVYEKIGPAWQRFYDSLQGVLALSRTSHNDEAHIKYLADANPSFVELNRALNVATAYNQREGDAFAAESQRTYSTALWILGIALSLCSVLGGGMAFIVGRGLNRDLGRIVRGLSEGAVQVASAAGQVAASSQSLAQSASEQAASLEETSASGEEINSMARKNTENSQAAAGLMTQSQQTFIQANRSLEDMVVAMSEINTQSDKISKIIKVIDEIAFQTNILALNAAVEAARAGEAGMGFAVVADEVRNLAQRCAQAARDTALLIEESIAKSDNGKQKVDQVASAIRVVTGEAAKAKTLVDEVSVGSDEQTRGIEQIAKAMTQMEHMTQRSAASAEESAAAAEQLTAQSESMKVIVQQLTAMVGGADCAIAAVPHKRATAKSPSVAPVFANQAASEDEFPMN